MVIYQMVTNVTEKRSSDEVMSGEQFEEGAGNCYFE